MQILSRYLGLTLIKSTLLVLAVFIGMEIFILLATQLNSVGQGGYSIWQAFFYVLLILPQQTYFLFPMAGLLGMLAGLSILANHSELIIMRAAGISPIEIMRKTLIAGIILILIMTLIGEVIAPLAKHFAERHKILAASSGQALKTHQGLWLRQNKDFFYIKTIYSNTRIEGISRYQYNPQQQLLSTSYAEEGRYQNGKWRMSNVCQSIIGQDHIKAVFMPALIWNLALNPHLLGISLSQPDEMNLKQLSDYITYQKHNKLSALNYQIAFWQRILMPFSSIIMMLIAVPFIFGPLRSTTTGLRLMIGVITGFTFYLTNQLFPPLSQVLNFPPFLAAILPLIIFSLIGLGLFRRI